MENLITLFTTLSEQFLNEDKEKNNILFKKKDIGKKVKLVRQKAFDIVHESRRDTYEENSVWYPEILITDYAYELLQKGADGASNVLFESIGALERSNVAYEEVLTLLLHLKGRYSHDSEARQHPFTLSGCDYFLHPSKPFELLPKELTCGLVDTPTKRKSPKTVFIDNFIEIPKKEKPVRSLPILQDLIENDLPEILPKSVAVLEKTALPAPRPVSPWSDFERDILDGAEFSDDSDHDPKKSFVEKYESKLNESIQDPFARKKETEKIIKRRGLLQSMYLENEHLKTVLEPSLEKIAYHEVELQDYIDQVKYLLLGVDGRIFKYDVIEKKYFMKCGIYVEGLSPDCLFEVSKTFLECGTFFKNLSFAIEDGICDSSGIINPVFWSSIANFLRKHCDAVASLPIQSSLMLLKMSTSNMCLDLEAVYRLCFLENGSLPLNGRLISYLFGYCDFLQRPNVVFTIIYDCCVVYFSKLLEKWMFQGLIDGSGDFFIRENNETVCAQDRSLYCSLTIDEEAVPIFLQNLALKIFSCGKAIWLLKMCDPENAFIFYTETKKTPKLRICFSDQDFSKMELDFKNFEKKVLDVTGKPVTFTSLRETGEEEERNKLKLTATPKKNPKVITEKIIEEEKKITREYYESLSREAQSIKNVAEWQKKRLELHDKRTEFLKQDFINENTILDQEGNFLAPTEADLENANIILERNLTNSPQKLITDNEALQNKTKILGTTLFDEDLGNLPKRMTTEAMKNKMKIMGTEEENNRISDFVSKNLNNAPMNEAMKNKLKILGSEYERSDILIENLQPKPLTEAIKNKMKVLGTEYDSYRPENPSCAVLTEALKNRNKILGTEIGVEALQSDKNKSPKNLTEAMRNKRKILGSEYGIEENQKIHHKDSHFLTEAQKNKLKILGTDFDVQIPEPRIISKEIIKSPVKNRKEDDFDLEQPKRKINIFEAPESQPSLLDTPENKKIPSFENMDTTTFTRYLQRSLLIALNVQERLANSNVLKHFLVKENFMAHISSLRCFYLLHDGEFSRSLSYGLFQSLIQCSEPQQFFDAGSLSDILNEALNCAHHSSQTNAQNVSFQITKIPKKLDKESHDVLSPFQLSYRVNWPINIVITPQILGRYRQVFHALINLKRVHWMLNETFLLLKSQTKDTSLDGKLLMNSPEYTKLATYRHAMTLFIMTLEEHLSTNGLQVAWNNFMRNLESVSDLDHLYQKHVEFIKDVCRRCFLSRSCLLLSYINELIELGLSFHLILNSSPWRLINEKQYSHPKFSELKSVFNKFCKATKIFTKALRKKSQHEEMAIHTPLLELINLKIKF